MSLPSGPALLQREVKNIMMKVSGAFFIEYLEGKRRSVR